MGTHMMYHGYVHEFDDIFPVIILLNVTIWAIFANSMDK